MTFSSDVKNEISKIIPSKPCCKRAELAGFSKAAGSIYLLGKGRVRISLRTENPAIARHIRSIIKDVTDDVPQVNVIEGSGVGRPGKRRVYELSATSERDGDLLSVTGIMSKGINDENFTGKCCRKSYLRGLFLGAGSMTDPDKSYHFELVFRNRDTAAAVRRLLNGFADIHAGVFRRNGKHIVYLKAAEQIKDVLGIMDAHRQLLAFEDGRMMKSIRGEANRLSNFDNANIGRTMSAAERQLSDIRIIMDGPGLGSLPDGLRDAALIRLSDNEASLAEIAAMVAPQVSKAAVSGRFRRLSAIADQVRNTP